MRYAIWDLVEDIPNYLSGPESKIVKLGGSASGAWPNGVIEHGADILGYIDGDFDPAELSHWNYREVSQAEALAFCQEINPEAYLLPDGRIVAPEQN